jgi:hypothetical protein
MSGAAPPMSGAAPPMSGPGRDCATTSTLATTIDGAGR